MGDILWTAAPTGGFLGTLVYIALLVYRGKLVPRPTVEALLARETIRAEVAEANAEKWQQVTLTQAEQITELLVAARVASHVLQSLPQRPEGSQ